MTINGVEVGPLVDEYETLLSEIQPLSDGPYDWGQVCSQLVEWGDWTEEGANALILLARAYGTFVLRNALALAAALNIEDGDLGI